MLRTRGPPGLPIIGHLHQLAKATSLHEYFFHLSKQYGSLMTLHMGSVPTLIVSSSTMAKEVLRTQDAIFCSRPAMTGQQKLAYNCVEVAFAPYNERWRDLRKFCTQELFTTKREQVLIRPVREQEVSRMILGLSKVADASEHVDAQECFSSLSSSIICKAAFGKSWDEDQLGKERFYRVVRDTEAVFSYFYFSDYLPMLGWIDTLTGMIGKLNRTFKDLDAFFQEIIDEHLKPDRPKSATDDLVDIMLRNQDSSSFALTMDNIKGILMDTFIAGTGTSAIVLLWAMTGIIRNPDVMRKAQDEIRRVIGKKGKADEDDIQNLPYLRAVVKETMRLYPPGPLLLPRETMQSTVIGEDKDHMYKIKSKTLVFVSMWTIGRDPNLWENPLEFVPERFLERPEINYKGQHFEYAPFGSGRRQCPGLSIGATNVELALSNLLYTFDWELPGGMSITDIDDDTINGVSLQKKNPLYIRPKKYACP